MGQRKAAFELSMGFIITVIFAVVLLTLALLFIQDAIKGARDITGQMEKDATEKLRSAFEDSETTFSIYPEQYSTERNTIISVTAGIKNNAADGESHNFAVNVIVEEAPAGVSKTTVSKWIAFAKSPKTVTPGGTDRIPIKINIPSDSKAGEYFFNIVACADITPQGRQAVVSSANCRPDSENIWGSSAKTFVLTVTA